MEDYQDDHIQLHSIRFQNWLVLDGLQGQKSHVLKMKYCLTCMIYRPRRTIHCSYCNTCIEQLDHHCPFISSCVGRRNYKWFYLFVNTLLIDSLFIFVITVVDLDRRLTSLKSQMTVSDSWKFAMNKIPLSLPIAVLSGAALLGLTALTLYHLKLNLFN